MIANCPRYAVVRISASYASCDEPGYITRSKLAEDVQQVIAAALGRGAVGIVVGIPYELDGEVGPSAQLAKGFIRSLRRAIGEATSLAVHEMDERYTSVEAEGLLRESGIQPSRQRPTVDETAAMLILQRFLAPP